MSVNVRCKKIEKPLERHSPNLFLFDFFNDILQLSDPQWMVSFSIVVLFVNTFVVAMLEDCCEKDRVYVNDIDN